MFIKNIHLINFRNHQDYSLDFSDTTVLIGENGVGKTNVLEAVWLISDGRSWRTVRDQEAISWGQDFAKIIAKVSIEKDNQNSHSERKDSHSERSEESLGLSEIPHSREILRSAQDDIKTLELILQNPYAITEKSQSKLLKINGVKKRLIDLLGQMPAVLFSPESLQLVDGSPGARRKFLDIMLSQISNQYAVKLLEYQKVLRERNKLLYFVKEGRAKPDELDFWDEKLATLGGFILEKRIEAVKFLNTEVAASYQEIAGSDEVLKLNYKYSVKPEKFLAEIKNIKNREIEHAGTLIGPHRDDLEIILNKRNLDVFGSRGEYRSAILALKVMEMRFLEKHLEEKPILLLDDIFSEFDAKRRKHLAKITENAQVIITTTDLDHIEKGLRERAKIVEIV